MMFRTYRHPVYARKGVAIFPVIAGALPLLAGLAVAVWGGYAEGWSWTGLPEQRVPKNPNEEYVRGKTLWDWLSLLIVPVFITVGGFLLSKAMKERENWLAADRQRQALLDKYFDVVSAAFVATVATPSAGGAPPPEADLVTATIIRARTLTTLQELDGHRKGALIRFLLEANLINKFGTPDRPHRLAFDIKGANLHDADLHGLTLQHVDLEGVDLRDADLRLTDLTDSSIDAGTQLAAKWRSCMISLTVYAATGRYDGPTYATLIWPALNWKRPI